MGLQSVIDYFLSKLEPYNSTYIDEEETTDNGGNRASDTKLLLEEDGDSQTQSPMGTLERGVTSSVQERGVTSSSVQEQGHIHTDSSEGKDHAKPKPVSNIMIMTLCFEAYCHIPFYNRQLLNYQRDQSIFL